jgi:hypothetical protein
VCCVQTSGFHLASFGVLAEHPGMPDHFNIVPIPGGDFRAERVVVGDQAMSYESATFHTARAASEWLDRQVRPQRSLRIDYTITPTETGTHRVGVRTDRSVPEEIGEFSTLEDATEFVRCMRKLDAGPTHSNP